MAPRSSQSALRPSWLAQSPYQHFIGITDDDICPDCQTNYASSSHLFSCPTHPTNLTTKAPWERPWEATAHVFKFNDLSALLLLLLLLLPDVGYTDGLLPSLHPVFVAVTAGSAGR